MCPALHLRHADCTLAETPVGGRSVKDLILQRSVVATDNYHLIPVHAAKAPSRGLSGPRRSRRQDLVTGLSAAPLLKLGPSCGPAQEEFLRTA
jgi:hypothetical protein